VNIALQQVMSDYAGFVRSRACSTPASLTWTDKRGGFSYDDRRNQHEVVRALEVLNLIELGELVCIAAEARKETRGWHERKDYPTKILFWTGNSC